MAETLLSVPRHDPTATEAIRRADRQPVRREVAPVGDTVVAHAFWRALSRPQRFGVDVRLVVRAMREIARHAAM